MTSLSGPVQFACQQARKLVQTLRAQVVAVLGNFHDLPMWTPLHATLYSGQRRIYCLLGGTLGHLDDEPRFLWQSLLGCRGGDLLLLDVESAPAGCEDPEEIKRRDSRYRDGISAPLAAWLGGPLWRQSKDITQVDFQWQLETRCPVPGSYALHTIATVKTAQGAARRFSMFRFARYVPAQLCTVLAPMGWEEIGVLCYGHAHSLCLYRKRESGSAAESIVRDET